MLKNVASQLVGVQMITASDGSDFTTAITCEVTVDGGTKTASGGTGPTHEGEGFFTYIPTQAETNGDHIAFSFAASGAISTTVQVYTDASYDRIGAPAGASVSADIADVPTVEEFEARTLVAASYFDPAADTVATVTTLTNLPTIPANWLTAAGTAADFTTEVVAGMNDLDAAGIRSAVGLAAANMDTQFTASATATGFATEAKQDAQDAIITEARLSELDAATAGKMANQVDIIQTDTTTDIPASISALNDLSAAAVNAEVVDALATDTYAEPAQGAPGATISLADKINFLYKAWRNRSTQTSTTYSLYNDDATTVDHKATVSDDATTADKGEVATGP